MPKYSVPAHLVIKEVRKRAGLTQKQLAEQVGLTQQAIALLEKGKRKIDADLFMKILNCVKDEQLVLDVLTNLQIESQAPYVFRVQSDDHLMHLNILPDDQEPRNNIRNTLDVIAESVIKLNSKGQKKAIEQVEHLAKIPEYLKDADVSLGPHRNAACTQTGKKVSDN